MGELERPEAVRPGDVWHVPVGRIVEWEPDEINIRLNELHAESPGLLELDGYRPILTETVVACPSCSNDERLTIRGVWGEPAEYVCPCGHEWPCRARLLQEAIVSTLSQHGPDSIRRSDAS